jgi:similar to stage IV sporulation protein
LAFLVALWALSSFVWIIEVEGSQLVDSALIRQAAVDEGLFVGALRYKLEQDKIADALLRQFPELAWATVALKGSRALIKVVDRAVIVPTPTTPGDIVAVKNGLLVKVIATGGQAVVSAGDTVVKGQILITGTVIVDESVVSETRAEGIAEARVWYESRGSAQLVREVLRPSGGAVRSESISVMGRWEGVIAGPRFSPYEYSGMEETKRVLLPGVEHISRIYREFILVTEEVTREEAQSEALEMARTIQQALLSPEVEIVSEEVFEELLDDKNTVEVRILVETLEDIGRFRAYDS